jgi:hypothetical protein
MNCLAIKLTVQDCTLFARLRMHVLTFQHPLRPVVLTTACLAILISLPLCFVNSVMISFFLTFYKIMV